MTSRAVMLSVAGNAAILGASWAVYGWNDVGVHVAARNTARFSALWYIVGLSAPGLARWVRALPGEIALIRAFVAAHMVHYISVIAVLVFERVHVSDSPLKTGSVIAGGFSLVLFTGLTAKPQPSPVVAGIHNSLLYGIFFIFLGGLLHDRFKSFRVVAVLLLLGLILRLTGGVWSYRSGSTIADESVSHNTNQEKSLRGHHEMHRPDVDVAFGIRFFPYGFGSRLGTCESGEVSATSGVGYGEVQRSLD